MLPTAPALAQTPSADPPTGGLRLGDADLPETRTTQQIAPGVTLTRIHRGDQPADPAQILTTSRGPWNVDVVTIDPRRDKGQLAATYGPDIAGTETASELAARSHALVATNGSFFTFTASKTSPGDPVGTGVYGGVLQSEPELSADQRAFVVDGPREQVQIARWTWSAAIENRRTRQLTEVDAVQHTPAVPAACATLTDQTGCPVDGDTVRLTSAFGATTPSGPGAEVVLDRRGCTVGVNRLTRGVRLHRGQVSLQATGRDAARLLAVAGQGCVRTTSALTGADGRAVHLKSSTFAVNGHPQLTENGAVVAPVIDDDFNARNPRTLAGKTADGKIVLAVIDGRSTASVGTTISETAAVAQSLGLVDSLNLDGGGSSTMVAKGSLVNTPSNTGGVERPLGDALVYLPR